MSVVSFKNPQAVMMVCEDCGVVNDKCKRVEDRRVCFDCGGTVLTLQEAGDRILELKSVVRQLEGDLLWTS